MTSSQMHPSATGHSAKAGDIALKRIAVGVDWYPEGRDAATLGAALAKLSETVPMLVSVHWSPLVVLPSEMSWASLHEETELMLRQVRDSVAPGSRLVTESNLSVAQALHHVAQREHRDLLVVGSSRQAPEGQVRIGKRTRQLLGYFECAIAVAPRGMHQQAPVTFKKIGVGYDGGAESAAALAVAASIATAAGASLHVRAVVDDRVPPIGFSAMVRGGVDVAMWEEAIAELIESLERELAGASEGFEGEAKLEVVRGRPAGALREMAEEVDLLVIGSRRWGPSARVLLGSTGEALLHDAPCAVLTVPRPSA